MAVLFVGPMAAGAELQASFASEMRAPERGTMQPLLEAACPGGVRMGTEKGRAVFGCGDVFYDEVPLRANKGYPWREDVAWRADGVLFGHFLSAASEDAIVSGGGAETHPQLYGGTLLLTKTRGVWKPVWYKMGVITRHCRRTPLADGREMLFCEDTDSGMGHAFHMLFAVDLLRPKYAWKSVVLAADTYDSGMLGGAHTQFIDRVTFGEPGTARVSARHAGVSFGNGPPRPTGVPARYQIDLRLVDGRWRATPETAEAAKLFGIR